MSVILDALKKMDETRTGTFEENNVQEFYQKPSHSIIHHYKYWIIASFFVVLMVLTGTLFFLHQKIASLPTVPVAVSDVSKVEETPKVTATETVKPVPEPAKPPQSSMPQNPPISEPAVVQPVVSNPIVSNVEPIADLKPKSEPAPQPESATPSVSIPDPDVNQQASEQVQAVIKNDPSVPAPEPENEESNVERNGITTDAPLATGVDNSIQFSETGPSDEALHQLKDNLAASMSRQNYAQIIEDAQAAISSYPKDIDVHYYLGLAYFNLNRYAEALNILTRLQPPMSHYPDYYAVLANVYMHQEALDNALYIYESLVGIYPDNGSYALGLGIIYQKQGKFAAAKATYQRILSFEPVYWGAYPFVQAQLKILSSVKE